ncbi:MAG: trypsin-like peptidase domain-containing protein [Myxococcaceae bacterium]|nr:trypsin-like peptidase domain-containing protein [Myxococcaceae bacterium]
MRSKAQRLAEIAARAAEGFVVLELKESYGVGFVAAPGRIVTTLHVVSDESHVTGHLATGQAVDVPLVAGIDPKRDLAVLLSPSIELAPLPPAPKRLAEEGTQAITFSLNRERTRTRWLDVKISAIQVLSDGLTVYRLEGDFPPDLSGSPLISARGEALGVVTLAQGDDGPIVLAVPYKYLVPLLTTPEQRPLSVLSLAKKARRRRMVPQYPVALLDGSSAKSLEQVASVLNGAINVAASALDKGDTSTSWRLYSETAERLIRDRHDCPGPMKALQEGLERARAMEDGESRVWALRDTFDALLMLVEKFSRARVAAARGGGRKPSKLLN